MSTSYKKWAKGPGAAAHNKNRRAKYKNDPAYREKVLERNRSRRLVTRTQALAEAEEARKARRVEDEDPHYRLVAVEVQGEDGRLSVADYFTISAVSSAAGCSLQAIRLWERNGEIPGPSARSPRGDRLYTVERIEEILSALKASGRLKRGAEEDRGVRPTVTSRRVRDASGHTHEVEMVRVSSLARVLGRIISTVEHLESRGILPRTPFIASSRGYRLYVLDMVESAAAAFAGVGNSLRSPESQSAFRAAVTEAWSKYAGWSVVEDEEAA